MKRNVVDWSVEQLYKARARISFPEYQRQPNLWSPEKKSLLIDSILREIDIPKLYFNQTRDGNYEVVDGQQRLWAIWEFLDGEYSYKPMPPYTSGKTEQRFSDLSTAQKSAIKNYKLQVTMFKEAEDDYLRELFIRLQLGLLLITGEKLNAASGAMKELVFGKLAKHKFIANLGVPSRRFAKETLCAQICINSFMQSKLKSFARTRYEDLQYFFQEYEHPKGKDLVFFKNMSDQISDVLDQLFECFGTKTKELKNRSYILSVYLFFEDQFRNGKLESSKDKKKFSEFVFKLWGRLKAEAAAGIDRKNRELYAFETMVSSAPGEKYQIERRHEKLIDYYKYYLQHDKIIGDK